MKKLGRDGRALVDKKVVRQQISRSSEREQPDRRRAILLAAQKLFAERGYHAVSIRDIAGEASVPLALVGYYYGAKHELYHAIFLSWQESIDERLRGLRDAVSDRSAPDVLERIIEAFVRPLVAMQSHEDGRHYARLAARDLAVPTPEADRAQRLFFDPMAHAFIEALLEVCPGANRGDVAWCYQFGLGAMLHYLTDSRVERLSGGENKASDPAAMGKLVCFIAAGFRGVLPS
jgi:AcrR family transcriptional regulator